MSTPPGPQGPPGPPQGPYQSGPYQPGPYDPPAQGRPDDLLQKPGQPPQSGGYGPAGGDPSGAPDAGQTAAPEAERSEGTGDFHAPAGFDERGRVRRGKVSATWVGLIAAAVVLILLIIFIAQNLNRASLHFLGLSGHMPLGLMLLIAAIAGMLLVAVPGSIRILQLRRALKINVPREQRTATGEHQRR